MIAKISIDNLYKEVEVLKKLKNCDNESITVIFNSIITYNNFWKENYNLDLSKYEYITTIGRGSEGIVKLYGIEIKSADSSPKSINALVKLIVLPATTGIGSPNTVVNVELFESITLPFFELNSKSVSIKLGIYYSFIL